MTWSAGTAAEAASSTWMDEAANTHKQEMGEHLAVRGATATDFVLREIEPCETELR